MSPAVDSESIHSQVELFNQVCFQTLAPFLQIDKLGLPLPRSGFEP